ncbi:transporter substrate-binding domain-containing protein [Desulfobotulus sp. H1]|uniref:Transporter substrate-binding domain-containing protein n=1 Tax=Desulfobotulus pelophilus TaxID=2823377 RepID=A0ABT3N565_9BACT|nr:transporter substrate-binding domain-containing protein [Desulfobotulus pelophilus]MCW7752603.1 transporter substrate-binding domain-containing protein [Desulfobotulus pelophilus]
MKHMILLLSLVFCLGSGPAMGKSLKIVTDEWPPYEFKAGEPGNEYVSGFATEVILEVLKNMNVAIDGRIQQYPWARAERMVIDGYADLLYTAVYNPERAQVTHYATESLMDSSWSFFIRSEDKNNIRFSTFNDLTRKTIGVVRGYAYTPELWEFMRSQKNFEEVTNDQFNIQKLMAGRIDTTVMDYGNGLYLINQMGLSGSIIPLPKPIETTSLYVVFSKNTVEKDFVDKFSDELKKFKTSASYKDIYRKYFGG